MDRVRITVNGREVEAWELKIRDSCYYVTITGNMYYHVRCKDKGYAIESIVAQSTRQLLWDKAIAYGIYIPYKGSNT